MGMMPGWAEISDRDVRAAAQSMRPDGDGVVDEVGVRVLHSLYANRFYPGVSVQQTRLRYVLLVPWLLETLASRPLRRRDVKSTLRAAEAQLAQRLLDGGETRGVVGKSTVEHLVKLPPSQTYWGFLRVLGVVSFDARRQRPPSLAEVLAEWSDRAPKGGTDDEGRPLDTTPTLPSAGLPCPTGLLDRPTTLQLTGQEREHLTRLLEGVCQFGLPQRPIALLGRLAASDAPSIRPRQLLAIDGADVRAHAAELGWEDPQVLERAARSASLAAVVRAVYAALVETECEADGLPVERHHRDALRLVLHAHGDFAANLDLHAVHRDAPSSHGSARRLVPGAFGFTLFADTLAELRTDRLDTPGGLGRVRAAYQLAEQNRKHNLARLGRGPLALARRKDCRPQDFQAPEPLHYRAHRVEAFLDDLRGEDA